MPSRSRRLSLLGLFVAVSAVILVCGAFVLGTFLTDALSDQMLDDARGTARQHVDGVLRPYVVRGDRVVVRRTMPAPATRALVQGRDEIVSVKVWTPDGRVAWTTLDAARIGARSPIRGGLARALGEGRTSAELVRPPGPEHGAERQAGHARLLEVYAPVRDRSGATIGAYEVYVDPTVALRHIAADRRLVWVLTAAVFLALWLALTLLVRGASRKLDRQTRLLRERTSALTDAYGALERRSLEAIESLNATVEARDPSAAGQSGRVQRLALAIGTQLGLRGDELDALAHGALLHDIGNIAVPDAVLAKPVGLTHHELEQVKLHADEGAAIVARLSPLHDAVPIVRHHHERWDGHGYPDGLAGEEIPLGAAIVSVAGAWEAMTRDRPFRWGLTPERALLELVEGRGAQFAPVVVDAFLAAVRIRRHDLWGGEGPTRRLAAVEMLSDR